MMGDDKTFLDNMKKLGYTVEEVVEILQGYGKGEN